MRDRIQGRGQMYTSRFPRWAARLAALTAAVVLCWLIAPSAIAQLPDEPPIVPPRSEKAPDVQPPETNAVERAEDADGEGQADAKGQADAERDAEGPADADAQGRAKGAAGADAEPPLDEPPLDSQPTPPVEEQPLPEPDADDVEGRVKGRIDDKAAPAPGGESVPEPSAEPDTEPVPEPGAEPGVEPDAEPSAEPGAEPQADAEGQNQLGVQFDAEGSRLMISQVQSGSIAIRAGLRANDEIVAINGRRVSSQQDFDTRLQAAARASGSAGLLFWRDDELHQVSVVLAGEPEYRLGRRRITYFRGPDGQPMPPPSLDSDGAAEWNGHAGPVYDDDYTPTRYRRARRARYRCW